MYGYNNMTCHFSLFISRQSNKQIKDACIHTAKYFPHFAIIQLSVTYKLLRYSVFSQFKRLYVISLAFFEHVNCVNKIRRFQLQYCIQAGDTRCQLLFFFSSLRIKTCSCTFGHTYPLFMEFICAEYTHFMCFDNTSSA